MADSVVTIADATIRQRHVTGETYEHVRLHRVNFDNGSATRCTFNDVEMTECRLWSCTLHESILAVALALGVAGLVETPFDIAFLTLRQRRTDPARFGRMFAVSMALNQLGAPVGSAIAGPLIAWSLTGTLWVAVGLIALAAAVPLVAIPAREDAPSRTVPRA